MKTKNLLFFILLFFLAACGKEEPTPVNPTPIDPPKPIFETVWSTRIYDAPLENVGSDNAYVYKDWYIVGGNSDDPSIFAFNKLTGELEWTYTMKGEYIAHPHNLRGINNLVLFGDSRGIAALDLDKKELAWEKRFKSYLGNVGQLTIYGSHVYRSVSFGNFYGPESLIRFNIYTGQEEQIIRFEKSAENHAPTISAPIFHYDSELNDTIAYMSQRWARADLGPGKEQTDMIAVSLKDRKVIWRHEAFTQWGTGLLYAPNVTDDIVLVPGDWSMYAFDRRTGELRWKTELDDKFKVGNAPSESQLLVGKRLYYRSGLHFVACLDVTTGHIIWQVNNQNVANCSPNMIYNDGMIITGCFGTGRVTIIDAETGRQIHSERGQRTFYTDVTYDPQTDMYFTQDFAHAVGFKINKP